METTTFCPKCGQSVLVDCNSETTEKELDELALQRCSCPEAKIWRQQQMQIAEAELNIESLCVADAHRLGMSEIENDEVLDLLKKTSRLIAYAEIKDATVATVGHGKIKISRSVDGTISVKRTVGHTEELKANKKY